LREGFKPVIDDESWSKEVRALLEMLGFYKMVEAIERTGEVVTTNTSIRFVQFRSSKQVVGASAEEIIDDLRAAGGETPAREWAYAALLEAIHNVANHAYPPEDEPPVIRNANMWWAAGAYHPKNQILQFVVYDRGVGIPFTLPKKSIFEAMILRGAPEWSDADLIKGGIEFGRTSTQQPERGNGLWTICQFVDQLPGSNVDIWSGKGAVRYHSNGKIETKNYANPFCGTLIKWNLKLPTDPQQVPAMS
jgi:hypothetical protein